MFPPIHDFPPFYTKQVCEETLETQKEIWSNIIQSYCRLHHIFRLEVDSIVVTDLCQNAKIGRKLSKETLILFLSQMAKNRKIKWLEVNSTCLIYWKSLEEWCESILNWVEKNSLNGSIYTFYEIREGDLSKEEDFYQMDIAMLEECLTLLTRKKKAEIFVGEDEHTKGIKFY